MGVGVFVLGMISLRFGTRVTRLFGTAVYMVGSLCLALASTDAPWLIFIGMPCVGFGGLGILATNIQVSFLFPVWGAAISSSLSGAFDASAGVQLLVKIGYENGISRSTSYVIMTCVFSLTLFNTFFLLPKHFYEKPVAVDTSDSSDETPKEIGKDGRVNEEKENGTMPPITIEEGEKTNEITSNSFLTAVISPQFLLHLFWFSLLHLRHVYYQASINSVLEETFDTDDEVSDYTDAFMYTLFSGTVVSFLPGLVYDYNVKLFQKNKSEIQRRLMPCVVPLALTSLIGIVLSITCIFTSPVSLYVEFILVVLLRGFLYSTLITYTRQLFPSEYFTTLYGIIMFGASLISLFQYALFLWAGSNGFQQTAIRLINQKPVASQPNG